MNKTLQLIAFCLLTNLSANAQTLKMGQFNQNEIDYKEVSYEPEAGAVILAELGDSKFFGDIFETTYFVRLKILSETGKGYGDISIRFYVGDDATEEISGIKAQTTNFSNGKPETIKVEKNNIFLVDLDGGYKEYRITFPNVQVGSILEYSYKKTDKSLGFLDGWAFQNPIPTLYSKYQIRMIAELEYKMIGQGYNFFNKAESASSNGTYSWVLRNLYSLKEEPFMKNYRDYTERIEFQLSKYKKYDPIGGVQTVDFLDTWEKLGDGIINAYEEMGYYRSNPIEKELLGIDLGGTTQKEIASKAYYYIRDKFINQGPDYIQPEQTLSQLLKSKSGTSVELILALMGILKSSGVECDPVLVGSKGYGRSELVDFPFLNQFDEILLLAKLDGQLQFIDLNDPLAPFGYVDLDKHVKAGLLLRKEQSMLVPIDIQHKSNTVFFSQIELDEKNNFLMKNSLRNYQYRGLGMARTIENGKSKEGFLEELLSTGDIANIQNIQVQDQLEENNSLTINYEMSFPESGNYDMLMFNPLKYSYFAKNPFTAEYRIFPVDFGYVFTETYNARIVIPEGYEIDDYPLQEAITVKGGYLSFSFNPSIIDGALNITARLDVKNPMIPVNRYQDLKLFMESVAAKLNAPVVLKKTAKP
ncbi:DUF3857 domain-containing protein [Algoriphagus sp. CAU 1675]|uniref:DUF3857 domain-containing protein n=1 Tax=Algoriphagus sp. CAU 1675 TaxID=3032597 RepID=UPI0023DBCCD2|nr:DUF3857 domain-containing protein [Algoriphagus sp. CAU 1675]MDF2156540.1 DUF3857 domain-containing protein [Algoriphagus sp. CAU 1675]